MHSWKVVPGELDQHLLRQPGAVLVVGAARSVHHYGKMVAAEEGGASPDAHPLVEAVAVAGEGSAVQDVAAAAFDDWKAAEEGEPRWRDT